MLPSLERGKSQVFKTLSPKTDELRLAVLGFPHSGKSTLFVLLKNELQDNSKRYGVTAEFTKGRDQIEKLWNTMVKDRQFVDHRTTVGETFPVEMYLVERGFFKDSKTKKLDSADANGEASSILANATGKNGAPTQTEIRTLLESGMFSGELSSGGLVGGYKELYQEWVQADSYVVVVDLDALFNDASRSWGDPLLQNKYANLLRNLRHLNGLPIGSPMKKKVMLLFSKWDLRARKLTNLATTTPNQLLGRLSTLSTAYSEVVRGPPLLFYSEVKTEHDPKTGEICLQVKDGALQVEGLNHFINFLIHGGF